MIKVDVREQNAVLKSIADEVTFLSVPNPEDPAHPFSYDIEVTTRSGQVLRFECKHSWQDAVASWTKREGERSRLSRQLSYVDAILVVWDEDDIERNCPESRLPAVKGLGNRLGRMALESDPPVILRSSTLSLISFLGYLENRKEPVRLAPRPQEVPCGNPC